MIHIECTVPLRASRDAAWRLLREQAEAPQRFVANIVECKVTRRGAGELIRRVRFGDGTEVTERVVLVPGDEVIFELLEHPTFAGEIRYVLSEVSGELWLSYYFRGETRSGRRLQPGELEQVRDGICRTVRETARLVEAGNTAVETA